jgi:Peptidase family M1 domain
MLRYRAPWWAVIGLAMAGSPASAQVGEALSPRNANYVLAVKLDPATRILEGRQTVTWRNIQSAPTRELWFHLYYNGWRNSRSTWMLEDRLRRRLDPAEKIRPEDWSWQEVTRVELLPGAGQPGAELTNRVEHVAPDDGNLDDRTVMKISLPRAVAPGQSVSLALAFRAKVPRTFARTGFRGDFFFLAHFYPVLGVYERDGWNCHQFHGVTEFYSDYGTYDVEMTVPRGWIVGATGKEVSRRENADGTATHRYYQADVHNFAWTTSPDYVVKEARFEHPGLPPVDMRLLMQPEHLGQAERHFAATRAALAHYGTWYGAYPYGHITVVDPAYGSRAGGMEYPTLFTCGTRLFNPFGGGSPEGVTIHEAGHQFWYGIVGNNEFEHAWLDEGFNFFSEGRAHETAYGPEKLVRRYLRLSERVRDPGGFFPVLFEDLETDRLVRAVNGYRPGATGEVPAQPTFRYYPPAANNITYAKTAVWLLTLERYLGWSTLQKILSTHFQRWKFRHPRPEDFFATATEVTGQDLHWFFDQVYRGSDSFDYAVDSVSSKPAAAGGFVEGPKGGLQYQKPDQARKFYRTEVVVRRLGGGIFPVDVLLVFQDGTEMRQPWDGRDRWRLIVAERPAKLKYAVVDPDRKLALDLNYTNNSRLLEPAATVPALKWTSKWMIWLQDLLATFAFFA